MNKISKRLRADAALILQACASNSGTIYDNTFAVEDQFFGKMYTDAGELAREALSNVGPAFHGHLAYAEAECMLLEGWKP